jgi:hypothetical protein
MADKDKVEVDNRPTSQIDLERRLERDHLPEGVLVDNTKDDVRNPEVVNAPYATETTDTSGYLGVSPDYMTYSHDTDKPLTADEGPEAEALKRLQGGVAGVRKFVDLRAEPSTAVGVAASESLNTAVSGESYSAKLVDVAPDYQGTASGDVAAGPGAEPTTTTKTTAPSARASAPKTGKSTN